MKRLKALGALALAIVASLLCAVSASGAPSDPFQYKYSFPIPEVENPYQIAVNHQTGNLLVLSSEVGPREEVVKQFDPNGNPVDFSGLGSPTIAVGRAEQIIVDNSGGPTQGNFYTVALSANNANGGGEYFSSFAPDGTPIGSNPHVIEEPFENPTTHVIENIYVALAGGGIGPDGKLWLIGHDYRIDAHFSARPYSPIGTPEGPAVRFPLPRGSVSIPGGMDPLGNFYLPGSESIHKLDWSNGFADLGPTGLPFVAAIGEEPLFGRLEFDPSTNDAYSRKGNSIYGVHYSDPLVPSMPFEAISAAYGVKFGDGAFAFDSSGQTIYVAEGSRISAFHREPPQAPFDLGQLGVDGIRSRRAVVHGHLMAGGAQSSYHFEYGTTTAYGANTATVNLPLSYFPVQGAPVPLEGLQPGTTYHVRMAASNSVGTTYGPDRTFTTYPGPGDGADPCPNVLARKQTSGSRLPDCRAYELASALYSGGYDVESYLAPGQNPFPGFPLATDKLLYSTHSGAIPGPWKATNKGLDPYLATRTANGWVTQYEGLPSDLSPAGSFASALGEADSSLDALAFAGPNLCSPCFGSGLETGIPVRLPDGQLVQGMAGSLSASVDPSAKPEGKVARYFSADGRKLIFASKYAFEPGANENESDLTVYERDLAAGTTEIVSTDPAGNSLTGTVSELDVSASGSRVLVGTEVSTDPQGNEYVHPYLHIAGRPGSIGLAPGTSSGVLYAGMSEDGSRVFFTTPDQLVGSDTDTSSDLYEAAVDSAGNLSLRLVTGANSDACSPVANENGEHWNTTGANADCSAVAISGGGGVAASTGAIYFLSPEQLDGSKGTLNEPNLYLATPSGSPSFVATLAPNDPLVLDSVKANATRRTGDFQTTPSGNYAVFPSAEELTGVPHFGLRNVFEFAAASGRLSCPSCDTSGTTDGSLADDVELAPNGLSLLEDGRVFFTTRFPLLLNDANGMKDVYEWSDAKQWLISAGTGPFDSGLLSASADGRDVFFFTHDPLAAEEDENGALMRIYDAREGGGFFKLPAPVSCKASDECHGPGTVAGQAPDIRSSGKTTQGNVLTCPKSRIKKRGQCVKKTHAKKRHHKKHAKKKGGAKKRAAKTNGGRGGRNA